MSNEINIDEATSSEPRTELCTQALDTGSVVTGQYVRVLDHMGVEVNLKPMAFALLQTDNQGKVSFVDGDAKPIRIVPKELGGSEEALWFLSLMRKSDGARPEWRSAPVSVVQEIAAAAANEAIAAAIEAAIDSAVEGAIQDRIEAALATATVAGFQVGDWKMRLDDVIPPNWFRSGEKFARQVYPELYELLGTDVVPDFRGHVLRQLIPGIDEPGSDTSFCPGESCDTEDEINVTYANFLIYGGLPATCDEITEA